MDRRAVLLILGGFVFLMLIALCVDRQQSTAEKFFSTALKAENVSTNVTVDGRTLTVRGGMVTFAGTPVRDTLSLEALRLAYARTLAERNPLFALPGTSPSDLSYAVNELQQTANQLADLQKDVVSGEIIRSSLYPIKFLEKAGVAEAKRLEFIAHTDNQHEKAYELAVRGEVDAYLSDLHTFRDAVSKVIPDSAQPYIAADKAVSKSNILSALDKIELGLRASLRLFDARMLCTRGFVARCNQQDISLPSVRVSESDHIDGETLTRARAIQSFFASITGNIQLRDAPLIVLSKSTCTAAAPTPPIFVVIDSKVVPGAPTRMRPMFVGDIRFIKIDEYGDLPFYKDLRSQGIEFVLSPPLLHYECMDEARDFTAVLSTRTILQSSSSTILYEADAVREANARALSGDPIGIATALAIKHNSAQFDQSLRDITWAELENLNLMKDGLRPDLDIRNLFFSRSGFSSLFATNNPSFVGDLVLFPSAFIAPSQQPYLYDSQVPSGAQKLKLRRDIREYVILHLKGLLL